MLAATASPISREVAHVAIESTRSESELNRGPCWAATLETSTTWGESHNDISLSFACLYTKHKSQKRKVWHDGRLVVSTSWAVLYDAFPIPGAEGTRLGECDLTSSQRNAIAKQNETHVEMEQFLVEIQGLWSSEPCRRPHATAVVPLRSQGMQKLLSTRFRKPGVFVPPDPQQQSRQDNSKMDNQHKRRRPLQPGEWQQRFYGNTSQPQQQQHVLHTHDSLHNTTPSHDIAYSYQATRFAPRCQMAGATVGETRSMQHETSPSVNLTAAPRHYPSSSTTMILCETPCNTTALMDFIQHDAAVANERLKDLTENHSLSSPPDPNNNNAFNNNNINRIQRNMFIDKNDYDPQSFYGVELDEEDDDEEGNHSFWFHTEDATPKQQCEDSQRNVVVDLGQTVVTSLENKHDQPETRREELLKIFCTGTLPKQTHLAEPSVVGPSSDTKEARQSQAGLSSFEVVLPSESSSSDED